MDEGWAELEFDRYVQVFIQPAVRPHFSCSTSSRSCQRLKAEERVGNEVTMRWTAMREMSWRREGAALIREFLDVAHPDSPKVEEGTSVLEASFGWREFRERDGGEGKIDGA